MNRWVLVTDYYEGIQKNAVNMLSGFVSGLLSYTLPVRMAKDLSSAELEGSNIIAVGCCEAHPLLLDYQSRGLLDIPDKEEGYSVYVGSAGQDGAQTIAIASNDERGVLYGCMQFIGEYCGDRLHEGKYIWDEKYFDAPLERQIPEWRASSAPAVKTRAVWTWGCVMYDYRAFFDNMARLCLNEVVIWNDCVPFNAEDVVAYAHGLGIKVIFGFAWGWSRNCEQGLDELCTPSGLARLKESVLNIYKEQYQNTGCDGIYFQSFTEMTTESINGKSVAEIVTEFVNDTAGALLKEHPGLHIQFGLHATSVKTHLEALKAVDSQIHIVWEDCGAFPYSYYPDAVADFSETYELTERLLTLRGKEERFGAVFKGMLNLDWHSFEHHNGSFILGERTREFINERRIKKDKIWKIIRAEWLKNADLLRKTVALIVQSGHNAIIEALVEDAMLENRITLPVAIYAEALWSPERSIRDILRIAAKHPFVEND